MPRVEVIILAAGRSTRFAAWAGHKLLSAIAGTTVVRASVEAAIDAGVGGVSVVTGAAAQSVETALHGLSVRIVHAPDHADGMAASIRRGVEAVRTSADAVMIALGDQPTVRADAYRRVVAQWRATDASIVTPRYREVAIPSHPTLFSAVTFDELLRLHGDVGARSVVARDPARVREVRLEWPAPRDIDTVEDLARVATELLEAAEASKVDGANRLTRPQGGRGQ